MAESIDNFVEPHLRWIELNANDDGGWPDQPGKRSSTMTTAEAIKRLVRTPGLLQIQEHRARYQIPDRAPDSERPGQRSLATRE